MEKTEHIINVHMRSLSKKFKINLKSSTKIKIDLWNGSKRSGEWITVGECLWTGKHIIYCTAKLDSYEYLILEDTLRKVFFNQ